MKLFNSDKFEKYRDSMEADIDMEFKDKSFNDFENISESNDDEEEEGESNVNVDDNNDKYDELYFVIQAFENLRLEKFSNKIFENFTENEKEQINSNQEGSNKVDVNEAENLENELANNFKEKADNDNDENVKKPYNSNYLVSPSNEFIKIESKFEDDEPPEDDDEILCSKSAPDKAALYLGLTCGSFLVGFSLGWLQGSKQEQCFVATAVSATVARKVWQTLKVPFTSSLVASGVLGYTWHTIWCRGRNN